MVESSAKKKRVRRSPTAAERAATYARGRLRLVEQLGGRCLDCPENDPAKLEFHHKEPRTWTARDTSRWVRLARYRREAAAGLIELLCGACNKKRERPAFGSLNSASKGYQCSDEPIPE
jgi:hypothetical protein